MKSEMIRLGITTAKSVISQDIGQLIAKQNQKILPKNTIAVIIVII